MSTMLGVVRVPQEKGPEVKLRVAGDEFYSVQETLDGYTAIYDPFMGLFTYADLMGGEFVSSKTPIAKSPPDGTKKHLRESTKVHTDKFQEKYKRALSPEVLRTQGNRTYGPYKGLLDKNILNEGEIKGLTVLVQFPYMDINVKPKEVSDMLNAKGYCGGGNFCSVRDYFLKMSLGRLDYTNEVVGPITLKHDRMYYHRHLLVEEALNAVVDMGVDLSKFDSQGRGIVDALSFLYAGNAVPGGELHPHNWYIDLQYGRMKTNLYTLSSLGVGIDDLAIGTICHETGHLLCRFPDLYDYGNRDGDFEESGGMGTYCLMSAGNWLNDGKTPAPISAYLRYLIGWYDQVVSLNEPGNYETKRSDYGTILMYKTNKPNEFFLVENRFKKDWDGYLPSSGLAVYHCDTMGSNEWQGGTPDKHYQCGLLQRDGHLDLEKGLNYGDIDDFYDEMRGVVISYDTTPSSKMWDKSDSGLVISDIGKIGDVITFVVGMPVVPPIGIIKGEAAPDLVIQDKDPIGVASTITLNAPGIIARIKAGLDITHTYIGDLKVELKSPSGKKVVLHDSSGGSKDDLVEAYDSQVNPILEDLVGESIQGNWTLQVMDLVKQDVGKLNKWFIEIVPKA